MKRRSQPSQRSRSSYGRKRKTATRYGFPTGEAFQRYRESPAANIDYNRCSRPPACYVLPAYSSATRWM